MTTNIIMPKLPLILNFGILNIVIVDFSHIKNGTINKCKVDILNGKKKLDLYLIT